jgi:alpha-D-xyloside xylohydrolase
MWKAIARVLTMELLPYIHTCAQRARIDGVNMIRPLSTAPPAYMFGEAFLVAPIVEQGARRRRVDLPEGSGWIDFHAGAAYRGGTTVTIDAPPERLPLFVRATGWGLRVVVG